MTPMSAGQPAWDGKSNWPTKRGSIIQAGLGFRVSRQFQSSDLATRDALVAVGRKLESRSVPQTAIETLELVLAEVLNNIVEHAYDAEGGSVDLSVAITSDGVRCRVADQGRSVPSAVLTGAMLPEADDLPEGGWGWYLVTTLAEDIRYQQENGWNVLRMTIPWDA